jgi:predicted DNA-binding transcriptional regulator AlpA
VPEVERPLLSIQELVRMLPGADGRPLSRQRAYALVKSGAIPGALRLGRRVVVRRAVLERWLSGENGAGDADRR